MHLKHGQILNQHDSDTNSRVNPIKIKFLRKDRSIPYTTREKRTASGSSYSDNFKYLSDKGSLFRLLDAMSEKFMEMK